jgi:hypothetical protein
MTVVIPYPSSSITESFARREIAWLNKFTEEIEKSQRNGNPKVPAG